MLQYVPDLIKFVNF